VKPGDILVPSPMLTFSSSNILLHFQSWPDGRLTSPQAPIATLRNLAESNYTTRGQIELATARLSQLSPVLNARASSEASATASIPRMQVQTAAAPALSNGDVLINPSADVRTNLVAMINVPALAQVNPPRRSDLAQQTLNSAEWNARANVYQQVQQQVFANNILAGANMAPAGASDWRNLRPTQGSLARRRIAPGPPRQPRRTICRSGLLAEWDESQAIVIGRRSRLSSRGRFATTTSVGRRRKRRSFVPPFGRVAGQTCAGRSELQACPSRAGARFNSPGLVLRFIGGRGGRSVIAWRTLLERKARRVCFSGHARAADAINDVQDVCRDARRRNGSG